jgi:WD40 repeat protein
VDTGKLLRPPLLHREHVVAVAFCPDNRTLVTGCWDGYARFWDASTGRPLGRSLPNHGAVRALTFSSDGKALLTGSFAYARLWEVPVPVAGKVEQIVLWVQVLTGTELDDNGMVRVLDGRTWRQRRQRLEQLGGPPLP